MSDWMAGVAEWDITPPLGVDMTGYAGRPGPADHVHDRLWVRALALRSGGAPLVLTCGDLLGVSSEMVAAIRERVADLVPAERLLLNHSHTHAGPTTAPLRSMGRMDPAYCDLVVRWTASAIREALRCLQPARISLGTATTSIGENRREGRSGRIVLGSNPGGAYDPHVYVLRVEGPDGRPLACWFSHATHPVIMGPSNTGLSGEWPGAACAEIRQSLGCAAVFAQGCCGDINPVRRGGVEVVRGVGRELAGAALVAWERAEPLEAAETAASLETVFLPQQKPAVETAEAALADAIAVLEARDAELKDAGDEAARRLAEARRGTAAGFRGWAEDYLAAARVEHAPAISMDVQALRIGSIALVATGAETFVEIGQQIQQHLPAVRTVALGYTNGCIGYLPTAKAFPLGGYEIEGAFKFYGTLMVTPDGERLTLEAAQRALRRVMPVQ
jgi:neutral ceramidase